MLWELQLPNPKDLVLTTLHFSSQFAHSLTQYSRSGLLLVLRAVEIDCGSADNPCWLLEDAGHVKVEKLRLMSPHWLLPWLPSHQQLILPPWPGWMKTNSYGLLWVWWCHIQTQVCQHLFANPIHTGEEGTTKEFHISHPDGHSPYHSIASASIQTYHNSHPRLKTQ